MVIKRKQVPELLINCFFLLVSAGILTPFLLVVSVSLSSDDSILRRGYQFIPDDFTFDAYRYIFQSPAVLLRAYGVTTWITVAGTLLSLLLTAMTAYGISRRDYRYVRSTTFLIFFTTLFSGGLVPSYILVTQYLHMKDTIWALFIPYLLNPFYILIMKGFLIKIPMEIIESAKIDGSSEWRIFFRIIMPLSTPALATIGLITSFGFWNSWFPALLYINNDKLIPLQYLLVRIMNTIDFLTSELSRKNGLVVDTSHLPKDAARMAMAILVAGPMLVVFPFFQRYFVKGITVGSLKG